MVVRVQKVLIVDGIAPQCAEILRENGLEVTEVTGKLSVEELTKHLEGHDTMLVRSATKVTSELMKASPGLKLVGRAGTGVDNIDLQAATRRGVLVMNTPGGNTISAAEHTCVMIVSLSRNLYSACHSVKEGKWERSKFMGSELYGKTLAVIGLGRIGREVAQRMQAFGMKILGYDPIVTTAVAAEWNIDKRELNDIWPEADYITVHTPLLPQTRNLINADVLSRCRRGVRVVNVARGGIVEEQALLEALESGQCGGAGLDVYTSEPNPTPALVQHPGVICTPHLGANTREAQLRVAQEIAEQVVLAAREGQLVGLVNATYLSGAIGDLARPWMQLCQSLGCIVASVADLPSTDFSVSLTLRGEDTESMMSYLGEAVLSGMMSTMTKNGINLVNAPLLAREAGLTMTLQHCSESETSSPSAEVCVTRAGGECLASVEATVQGGAAATLLKLNNVGFSSGVTLGGNMLFLQSTGAADAMVTLISWLVEMGAQVLTVLTSDHKEGVSPIYAVRTAAPLPEHTALQPPNAKLLLQRNF